ncbi:MAG: VWD domain-containing protein [Brumimicrobium sp.]
MKHTTLILFVSFLFSISIENINAQSTSFKKQDSEHIKNIFEAWDKDAGNYLYESVASIVMHQEQPDRPEGINKTPFELLQSMHLDRIDRLKRAAKTELQKEKESSRGKRDAYFWQDWINYLETSTCEMQEGSSTGEPHMLTFDGERYDFQNAGDYLLSSSRDGTFEIQTQLFRRNAESSWSLNGGVALNVNGDVIEFRGTEEPIDGEVYVNEKLISERNTTLNLPNGGTIRLNEPPKESKNRHISGDRFVVKWPTGEQLRVAIIRNFSFGDNTDTKRKNVLYQLYVGVPECRTDYYGLFGNNDGEKNDLIVDDTTTINNDRSTYSDEELFGALRRSPKVLDKQEQTCLYIAYPFANIFQLNDKKSLFPIQMTAIPDSIRYPSGCISLADASDEQIAEGRKKSEEAGIPDDEMYSTVFDYVYADIDPADQVDSAGFRQPKRTTNEEPDLNTDENETPKVKDEIPNVFKEIDGKIDQRKPNTKERPENERKPTNNNPAREPRSGGR